MRVWEQKSLRALIRSFFSPEERCSLIYYPGFPFKANYSITLVIASLSSEGEIKAYLVKKGIKREIYKPEGMSFVSPEHDGLIRWKNGVFNTLNIECKGFFDARLGVLTLKTVNQKSHFDDPSAQWAAFDFVLLMPSSNREGLTLFSFQRPITDLYSIEPEKIHMLPGL